MCIAKLFEIQQELTREPIDAEIRVKALSLEQLEDHRSYHLEIYSGS